MLDDIKKTVSVMADELRASMKSTV